MLLTGTYPRTIDDKGRFSIPRQLRGVLGIDGSTTMFLAPGTDGSLALYSTRGFQEMAERLGQHSPTARDVRAFSRLLYARATRVEVDRQGRIRLPHDLTALIGVDRELVLVGVRDHLELWEPKRWEAYLEQMQPFYDQMAERAFGEDGAVGAVGSVGELGVGTDGAEPEQGMRHRPGQPR